MSSRMVSSTLWAQHNISSTCLKLIWQPQSSMQYFKLYKIVLFAGAQYNILSEFIKLFWHELKTIVHQHCCLDIICTIQYFINMYEVGLASPELNTIFYPWLHQPGMVRLFWQPQSSIQYFIVVLISWAQNNISATCMKLFLHHGLNTIFHQHV